MFIIYMHTLPNDKSYIGQTSKVPRHRFGKDFTGYEECPLFWRAIQKYGHESISTTTLCQCETLDQANRAEAQAIKEHNTLSPNGYNLTTGGSNSNASPETRAKMSKTHKGKVFTDEHIENLRHPKSAEAKKNMRGPKSTEHKKKISLALSGKNNPMSGKKHSEESKRKLSESLKGRPKPRKHKSAPQQLKLFD